MPIRRSVASSQEAPSKKAPAPEPEKADADVSSEESASTGEEQENETPAAAPSETEKSKSKEEEEGEEEAEDKEKEKEKDKEKDKEKEKKEKKKKKSDTETAPEEKKEENDESKEKEKEKKVKKTIPSWATLSASQLARVHKQSVSTSSRPKMDAILTEAIKACLQRSGASVVAIRKYIINKYPSLDLDRRGYLLKQALKRELTRGAIKQVKGKGASGSFVMVGGAGKTTQKTKGSKKKKGAAVQEQPEKLEDALPLVFTRLCEPKEASYGLIKKYVAQHYPKLGVDARPQLLKNAIQRAVEKGYLEQITGKGATGTFQLKKKSGDKYLLSGGPYEDAILSAITAMNEPKTCSTTLLKKYVLDKYPSSNSRLQVHYLKRILRKCEKNGWMEQISGKGFSGTFMLCFPYYPSPGVLFPDKQDEESEDESEDEDTDEEDESEESEEESESEEDEPPKKKANKRPKRPAPKARARATPQKRTAVRSKPRPSKELPAKKEKAKSTPKKEEVAPPKSAPSPKKSKPAPVSAKKENETPKKPASSAKGTQSPAKGKTSTRRSSRGK